MKNSNTSVDLHVHLFMEAGIPRLFHGSFYSPLQATSWKNRFSSQVNEETLEQSNIGLLVVALYAHPLLTLYRKKAIHQQIDLVEAFIEKHPQWILARTPNDAENAYNHGKRILIFSLEGIKGVLETEKDVDVFIRKRGISIVTFMHLTNNDFGGAALLHGTQMIHSPRFWLASQFMNEYAQGVKINAKGLTEKGKNLLTLLLKQKVWIDLSHASDNTQKQIIPLLQRVNQPLLYTHLGIRSYCHSERGLTSWQLNAIKNSQGMLGLLPSRELLLNNPDAFLLFAKEYREVSTLIGPERTVIGSDLNGPLQRIPPTNVTTKTSLDTEGFWHIGQTPDLWKALQRTTHNTPKPLSLSIETFIKTWKKVYE